MTDRRPVLIGEAPSKGGDRYHGFPLSGPPARVLCTLAGIPHEPEGSTYGKWTWALYDRFECVNLFRRYADATPWSVPSARARAEEMIPDLKGRVVVALGRRVQTAISSVLPLPETFGFHAVLHRPERDVFFVAIPHPSGLNRALNDPAERERCGESLRLALAIAAGDPPGEPVASLT